MNVFGIGLPEMALIMVLALLVFGPKKLPEIGRSLGKTVRSFQDASKEFESEFKREAEQIERTINEPMKATLEPKALSESATHAESAEVIEKVPASAREGSEEVGSASEHAEPANQPQQS
ncbi:MAG: TatA/E family twin arginine-targeting protein translocase [Leptolyngbyaceae cyanobacterium CSU_1_4]|nr:TatA/E family twin arginine-targeting protein translocase [Leptolyngbyaceae cyanobacterium CSU_1_4]